MKKIILSFLSLMLYTSIFGQDKNPKDSIRKGRPYEFVQKNYNTDSIRDEIINKSDYVFEGKIIRHSTYMRGNPVESNIVRIKKVFRGKLSIGTVEILRYIQSFVYESPEEGENNRTHTQDSLELIKYHFDVDGIFFCRVAHEYPYDPKYNIDHTDNKIILTYYNNSKYKIGFYGDRIVKGEKGYVGLGVLKHGRIKTKAEIYQILRRYPNLNIPDTCEPEPWAEADKISEYGPNATYKSRAEEQAHIDSVRHVRALIKAHDDSVKNVQLQKIKARNDSVRNLQTQLLKAHDDSVRNIQAQQLKAHQDSMFLIRYKKRKELIAAKRDSVHRARALLNSQQTILNKDSLNNKTPEVK